MEAISLDNDDGPSVLQNGARRESIQHDNLDTCTICLCPLTERAVVVPCNHLTFDFICLVQWLQTSASCPLCKVEVIEVQYDFRGVEDFKRYVVPRALSTARLQSGELRHRSEPPRQARIPLEQGCQPELDESISRRRKVYERLLYSSHIGSSTHSGYVDFTPVGFSTSQRLQSKARTFLRRELQAISNLQSAPQYHATRRPRSAPASIDYLVEFVVAVLRNHEPRSFDGCAEDLIAGFFPVDIAKLLLHELVSWLRSPYDTLRDWDAVIQY